MKNHRKGIEEKPSRTAAWTCTCRALSFLENDPQYKSGDSIAPELLPKFLLLLFKMNFFRQLFKKRLIPSGMYEYIVARTKYFDSAFKNAVKSGIRQILVFGAGYDSRGIRLLNRDSSVKVFELDTPATQDAKISQFTKRGIALNPNIVFIPIDFNKESLRDRLKESGFEKDRTLFLLEGLMMYLDREAVASAFQIIDEFSASGSEIVFDYIYRSVLEKKNTYYGEKEIYNTVKSASEEWRFGFAKGEAELFLRTYHFDLLEDVQPDELEKRYFKTAAGKINGTHCIAGAKKTLAPDIMR